MALISARRVFIVGAIIALDWINLSIIGLRCELERSSAAARVETRRNKIATVERNENSAHIRAPTEAHICVLAKLAESRAASAFIGA